VPYEGGFLVETRGGLDGRIIRVTNLDSHGPGSLRAALDHPGPRVIIFDVGGVIDLDLQDLSIAQPHVTVAGQAAPDPGITIIRGGVRIATHDVVVQHVRVRPGDAGESPRGGWEPEGISTSGKQAYNVIIDHCSVSWAVDENASVSGPQHAGREGTSHNVLISNCIIAEGLEDSSHHKGPHSKGTLIHDHCTSVAIVGNLYAHNDDRNPYLKADTTAMVANNLIYNPGIRAISVDYVRSQYTGQEDGPERPKASIIGNVLIHGRDTRPWLALVSGRGDVYLRDNVALSARGRHRRIASWRLNLLDQMPVWLAGYAAMPSDEVRDYVLRHAGARPAKRDAVDRRIVKAVTSGSGRIIGSQDDVGGYPAVAPTRRRLEIPEGSIEAWLDDLASQVERRQGASSHLDSAGH
jgi:hypothetical protein